MYVWYSKPCCAVSIAHRLFLAQFDASFVPEIAGIDDGYDPFGYGDYGYGYGAAQQSFKDMKQVQLSILVYYDLIGGGQGRLKVNFAAKSHFVNLGFSKPQT